MKCICLLGALALSCAHGPAAVAPEQAVGPVSHPPDRSLGFGALTVESVSSGDLQARLAPQDQAGLVVMYGGEERGALGTCGCPTQPRGGVARQHAYVQATRDRQPDVPVVVVNGGYWLEDAMDLSGNPRADVPVLNQWMVAGMQDLAPDALNVGYNDMAGITSLGRAPDDPPALPLVSANVHGAGVERWRMVQAGGLQVAITGITTPGVTFIETPGFAVSDPVKAGKAVLETLADKADVVILLAYGDPVAAKKLAQTGLVDVVVDTNLHRELYPPFREGEAIWVRSHFQTMRLGELRLTFKEGQIVAANDRKIQLDEELVQTESGRMIAEKARLDIERVTRFQP